MPQAAIELITRQAADATATFLTGDHLDRSLAEIEQRAGVAVRDVLATRVTSPEPTAPRGTHDPAADSARRQLCGTVAVPRVERMFGSGRWAAGSGGGSRDLRIRPEVILAG